MCIFLSKQCGWQRHQLRSSKINIMAKRRRQQQRNPAALMQNIGVA